MRVVADIDIPFLKGVLEPYADVEYLKGSAIDSSSVKDADALLIRTRTQCNEALLGGSSVKFIASATIGTDHVDLEWLSSHDIAFASAPGCNAGGVMQYVFTALYAVAEMKGISLNSKTLGVIGTGNTGGRVARLGEHLGFRVLRNDPPKEAISSDKSIYCSLEHLLCESDIITMHVPLDASTRSMASDDFFSRIPPGAIFINASRGEAVCESALRAAREKLAAVVLDVWNGEPRNISRDTIAIADIATTHIAGYSYEGKINGTAMIVQALARHFGIRELLHFEPPHTETPHISFKDESGRNLPQKEIALSLLRMFPIFEVDELLRKNPLDFEKIRSEYVYRREFNWR